MRPCRTAYLNLPALAVAAILLAASTSAQPGVETVHVRNGGRIAIPAPDCRAHVGWDRNLELPGYLLPSAAGPRTCVPFTTSRYKPPAGYAGDFYVDNFTDARLRAEWLRCKADPSCLDTVRKPLLSRRPPNKEFNTTDPRARFLLGKIEDRGSETDLALIRRPGYFGAAPYNEPIAADEAETYTVEFEAPPDPYERLHMGATKPIYLRGWYLRGEGVAAGAGKKQRALIVFSGGGGDRVAAIDDPADRIYSVDPKTGYTAQAAFPNGTTGAKGEAAMRRLAHALHRQGFDVLLFDRRGCGISGGFSDTNTLQQGRDLLRIVSSLRDGSGLRALTPAGETLSGRAAAGALRGRSSAAGLPVLLLGSSRGSMATSWAMTINFSKDCTYDLATIACSPAHRDSSIKGAILLSSFSSGAGYVPAETNRQDDDKGLSGNRGLFIGGTELESNIVFFPSSAVLASIGRWPSLLIARGLWDYATSLEGEVDSYSRVHGLKELIVVRGPHDYQCWPATEQDRVTERIAAFSKAVVLGEKTVGGGRPWSDMKELVGTTSDVWEPSTHPEVK